MNRQRSRPRWIKRVFRTIAVFILLVVLAGIAVFLLIGQIANPPKAEVQANAAQYDALITQIESGRLFADSANGGKISLPQVYKPLSAAENGEAIIERNGTTLRVYFYPHGQWVYVYLSDNNPDVHTDSCSPMTRDRDHWFWMQCYMRNP